MENYERGTGMILNDLQSPKLLVQDKTPSQDSSQSPLIHHLWT